MTNTLIQITEEEWIEKYKPTVNHLDENAGYDFGLGRGSLYETYGQELDYVWNKNQTQPECIWTVIEGDAGMYIVSGYHHVNRLGYVITEKYHSGIDANIEVELEKFSTFLNKYKHCGTEWEDTADCMCNDHCPVCDAEIEPYESEELES